MKGDSKSALGSTEVPTRASSGFSGPLHWTPCRTCSASSCFPPIDGRPIDRNYLVGDPVLSTVILHCLYTVGQTVVIDDQEPAGGELRIQRGECVHRRLV